MLIKPFNDYHSKQIPMLVYKFGKLCLFLGKDLDNARLVEKINHLLENEYNEFISDCDDQISKTILDFLRAQKQSVQKGRMNQKDNQLSANFYFELINLIEKSLVDALLSNMSNQPNLINRLGQIEFKIQSIMNSQMLRQVQKEVVINRIDSINRSQKPSKLFNHSLG